MPVSRALMEKHARERLLDVALALQVLAASDHDDPAWAATLEVLAADGVLRPTDLAHDLRRRPSMMRRTLARMEEAGLVEPIPDPTEPIARAMRLTAKGKRAAVDQRNRSQALTAAYFATWTDQQLNAFLDVTALIVAGAPTPSRAAPRRGGRSTAPANAARPNAARPNAARPNAASAAAAASTPPTAASS